MSTHPGHSPSPNSPFTAELKVDFNKVGFKIFEKDDEHWGGCTGASTNKRPRIYGYGVFSLTSGSTLLRA